jgi:hypothetical protein
MLKVTLKRVQSIIDAEYELEEEGITQITGANSNGKSILFKALQFTALCQIKDKDQRLPMINDDSKDCDIILERNGYTLWNHAHEDRDYCYYMLKRPDGTSITRNIREGGFEKLVDEFGFAVYGNNSVCLQVSDTFGLIPFVSESYGLNYEIVESIISDPTANAFVELYASRTFPKLKEYIAALKNQLAYNESLLKTITFYDDTKLEYYKREMESLLKNLQCVKPLSVEPIPFIENSSILEMIHMSLPMLPIVEMVEKIEHLESLEDLIVAYSSIKEGICPTCKQTIMTIKFQ